MPCSMVSALLEIGHVHTHCHDHLQASIWRCTGAGLWALLCVEVVDMDEFDGIGEDGHEGTMEFVLVLDDWQAGIGYRRVKLLLLGILQVIDADGEVGDGSLMSDVRCCSCRDASNVVRC